MRAIIDDVPRAQFERATHSLEVFCSIKILINFIKRKIYVQKKLPTFIPTFYLFNFNKSPGRSLIHVFGFSITLPTAILS